MPELHSVGVLLLMARRVAVITIPTKKERVRDLNFLQILLQTNVILQSIVQRTKGVRRYNGADSIIISLNVNTFIK